MVLFGGRGACCRMAEVETVMLLYQRSLILTCFMAVGDRPVRSPARRDAVPSGKRRDAAGRSPTATAGRDKITIGGVAIHLWCAAPPDRTLGREPLLPNGDFLSGETGQYQGSLVLDHIVQRADKLLAESDVEAPAVWGRSGC